MGHKVHPNGFRLGVYRNWEAKWFAPDKEFKPLLLEDVRLRRMLMTRLKNAGVADIDFGQTEAKTTFGRIGVSAWVYTGNFPTEAPPKPQAAVEEPVDSGVPVGAAIGEAPAPLAELVQQTVAAPVAPETPAVPVTAGPAPEAPAAAKPKRTRTPKPTATADGGEKPKRTSRAKTSTGEKATELKAPRARAPKKKE